MDWNAMAAPWLGVLSGPSHDTVITGSVRGIFLPAWVAPTSVIG